jgi:hypothetical protein
MRIAPRIFGKYSLNSKPEMFIAWLALFDKCHQEKFNSKVNLSFPVSNKLDPTEIDYIGIEELGKRYTEKYLNGFKSNNFHIQCYINKDRTNDNLIFRVLTTKSHMFEIEIDEKMKNSDIGLYTDEYIDFILLNDLADIVSDFSKRFKGNKPALYLFLKSIICKPFMKFSESRSEKDEDSYIYIMLNKIQEVLPKTELISIKDDNTSILDFLKKCDQILVSDCGKDNIEAILEKAKISFKKWLT